MDAGVAGTCVYDRAPTTGQSPLATDAGLATAGATAAPAAGSSASTEAARAEAKGRRLLAVGELQEKSRRRGNHEFRPPIHLLAL